MRRYFVVGWVLFVSGALYLYFFNPNLIQNQLQHAFGFSIYLGYAIYLILILIRGFTLIPVTYLIILGLLFFQPLPLYILTMLGVLVSSSSIYYFFEFLHLDKLFEHKYQKRISKVKSALQKNELPIIIGWSAAPFLATDIICYICGTLRINFTKFIIGIFIGEGITSGLYIFFGRYILQYIQNML